MTKRFAEDNPRECFCGICDDCDPIPPLVYFDKKMTVEQSLQMYKHIKSKYDNIDVNDKPYIYALVQSCNRAIDGLDSNSVLYEKFRSLINSLEQDLKI